MEHRIEALRGALPQGVDAALIAGGVNRAYYTGFSSSAGYLFVARQGAVLLVDGRYIEAAQTGAHGCEVRLLGELAEQVDALCAETGARTVGVDADQWSVWDFCRLRDAMRATLLETAQTAQLIRRQRAHKSEEEFGCLRRAQAIGDAVFAAVLPQIRPGMTDRDLQRLLNELFIEKGAQRAAHDFLVVCGPDTSYPHGKPSGRRLEKGDFVLMDMGTTIDGYWGDMTRTVLLGRAAPKQRLVYETVQAAQQAAFDAVRVGVPCREVDAAARGVIERAGFGVYFGHGLGHSLGLDVHEDPRFNQKDAAPVRPGMAITVEPGIYLPGEFGVRIEDTILIHEDGRVENITHSPHELIEL